LETKIIKEMYFREKKSAILLDRKLDTENEDAVSHLSRVQNKLPALLQNQDIKSNYSITSPSIK